MNDFWFLDPGYRASCPARPSASRAARYRVIGSSGSSTRPPSGEVRTVLTDKATLRIPAIFRSYRTSRGTTGSSGYASHSLTFRRISPGGPFGIPAREGKGNRCTGHHHEAVDHRNPFPALFSPDATRFTGSGIFRIIPALTFPRRVRIRWIRKCLL